MSLHGMRSLPVGISHNSHISPDQKVKMGNDHTVSGEKKSEDRHAICSNKHLLKYILSFTATVKKCDKSATSEFREKHIRLDFHYCRSCYYYFATNHDTTAIPAITTLLLIMILLPFLLLLLCY